MDRIVPNMNELNAAYAADGYARIKQVPGVCRYTHSIILKAGLANEYFQW